jgi:hypothetical protein
VRYLLLKFKLREFKFELQVLLDYKVREEPEVRTRSSLSLLEFKDNFAEVLDCEARELLQI